MVLSLDTANQIVSVVANDHISRARIEGPTMKGLLSRLHIAGGVRNAALLTMLSNDDPAFVRKCCLGIAEATYTAIFAGMRAGLVTGLRIAGRAERVHNGWAHKATRVVMVDDTQYVFDWFPTLELENPVIYRLKDWRVDTDGIEYADFEGFDNETD